MDDSSGKVDEEISSQLTTRLRRLIPIIMAITGVIFMVAGVLINHNKTLQNSSSSLVANTTVGSVAGEIKIKSVIVDVAGAVEQPGVYSIPYDSRISNVLITAGGLAPKADRNYISRYINLAQRVSDGMKIYFPFENEVSTTFSNQSTRGMGNIGGLININTGSLSELDSLPGIGPVTADKIIAARPYQDLSELTSKGVVSKTIFEKIKDKIGL